MLSFFLQKAPSGGHFGISFSKFHEHISCVAHIHNLIVLCSSAYAVGCHLNGKFNYNLPVYIYASICPPTCIFLNKILCLPCIFLNRISKFSKCLIKLRFILYDFKNNVFLFKITLIFDIFLIYRFFNLLA